MVYKFIGANMEKTLARVAKLFDDVIQAKSFNKLIEIESSAQFTDKERKQNFPGRRYPQLKFSITADDIKSLKGAKFLEEDGSLSLNCANENILKTPLEKLLFSVLWKNGDLGKEKHITDGIIGNRDNVRVTDEKGLVFYYFGKHLNQKINPIIDQHVIRAFMLYKVIMLYKNGNEENCEEILSKKTVSAKDKEICEEILSKKTVSAKDKEICLEYIEWQKDRLDKLDKKADQEMFSYHLDRLLFGLGKSIKS
jgi:hypothetical protein